MIDIVQILTAIDDVMYYPILIIIMAIAGLYFTARTKGVQIRLFPLDVANVSYWCILRIH